MDEPRLFTVGPVWVNHEVLKEMEHQMFSHRSDIYENLQKNVVEKTKNLMKTKNDVFIFTSSSTGVMETCARNFVKEKVLCLSCGAFGDRFAKIFELNGKKVQKLSVEWGMPNTPDAVDAALAESDAEAVAIIHNETSTGLMNPIKEIGRVCKKYGVLYFVDTVSSMGGAEINVDDFGIDVCFFGVQKCMAVPPGLAIASVSKKAIDKAEEVENKGFYFNITVLKEYLDKGTTPYTPPIPQMFALDKSLDLAFKEGIENRIERHKKCSSFVREGVKDMGFEIFPDEKYASQTLTCVDFSKMKTTHNFNVNEMFAKMKSKGFVLANGYGKIKDRTFRIGNMGNVSTGDVFDMINCMKESIK